MALPMVALRPLNGSSRPTRTVSLVAGGGTIGLMAATSPDACGARCSKWVKDGRSGLGTGWLPVGSCGWGAGGADVMTAALGEICGEGRLGGTGARVVCGPVVPAGGRRCDGGVWSLGL